jgi:O-antigen/teichoic acid export membrane protein
MSRKHRAAKGFATAIIQYISQIMVQVLLAPLVLLYAGRETLGAYAALMQTLGFFSIVNITGSWVLDRFLAQATGLQDGGKRFREIFTTYRSVLLITNFVYAVLVIIFSFHIARLLQLSPGVARQARYALYIIAIWMFVTTPFRSYQNALTAKQDMAQANIIATCTNIGRSVASLLVVIAGAGLFGLIMAGTVVQAIGGFSYWGLFRRRYPDLMPHWGIPDKKLLREMLTFGGYTSLMSLGNRLFLGSANMLAGFTNGAVVASSFYTTQMPAMTGYNLLYRLTESSTPAIHEIFGARDMVRLRNAFIRLVRLMLITTFPLAVGVFIFNKDLVTCWVGPKQYAGSLLTDTLAIYVAFSALQGIALTFSYVIGWVRLLAITSLLQGAVNIGLGYYLGKHIGIGGITLALDIVILPQLLFFLVKVSRVFEVNTLREVTKLTLRSIVPLGLASAAGLYIHTHVRIAHLHYGGFIAEGLAFCLVYALIAYWMVMNKQDQEDTRRYLLVVVEAGRKLRRKVFSAAS